MGTLKPSFLLCTLGLALSTAACAETTQVLKLVGNDSRDLRAPHPASPRGKHPDILVLALDGIDRALLYPMLAHNELPEMAALLGESGGAFPHAQFDESVEATLPSTTAAAWAAVFTGRPPAENGVPGNEFFIRQNRQFAAPIPNSASSAACALAVFTEGYANGLLKAPTVYERIREREPNVRIWISMSQYYRGADRFLLTRRAVLGDAFQAIAASLVDGKMPRKVWADLDSEDVEVVAERLAKDAVPDVLTVYLFGADDYAHMAEEGPDPARRGYLREVVDPAIGKLRRALSARGALDHRYVLITGDHGHTQVVHDDAHALAMNDKDDPPAVVKAAGFRLRPFKVDVDENDDFQAVLAYEGAMAFAYVADRSTCESAKTKCDWVRPARYNEDVVPLAQAFFDTNLDGRNAPSMKGTLDMIFVRPPAAPGHEPPPFEVYVGDGHTVPIASYFRDSPHPTYVDLEARLRDLTIGPYGDRAGDVILLAHNGDRERAEERFYFAPPYRSWHGSPSKLDSDVPLIVSHPHRSTAAIRQDLLGVLGQSPRQQKLGDLIVHLREEPFY